MATTAGERLNIEPETVLAMRDVMFHRGPDGAGIWDGGNIRLAHRRLAVVDPTPTGAQPMASPDGRFILVYNGELYNERDLREELERRGVRFVSTSDTETVLMALAAWGPRAISRFRGMYAIGLFDAREQTLLLARDPLGIKPLYYRSGRTTGQASVVFASEIAAILTHPDVEARPDLITVSAYLSTIRTVLGERTLFQDIRTMLPGEIVTFDLKSDEITPRRMLMARPAEPTVEHDARQRVRTAVNESLRLHLRADVPLCCLLSGGLDSSILAMLASRQISPLNTYCSGAAPACEQLRSEREADDFMYARAMADRLRTNHASVPVTPQLFTRRWREMVDQLGVPLSTPNEVAINEVSRRLRRDGFVAALSGEGADELFGGYISPLNDAMAYLDSPGNRVPPGIFELTSNAWMKPEIKPTILNEDVWRAVEHDGHLLAYYEAEFNAVAAEREDEVPLQAHLRFHRRINLAGLLQRLDTATMLASVEGRTPYADSVICQLAESLPMEAKFATRAVDGSPPVRRSKRVLRAAFEADLPAEIVARPKASFPLPFQDWVAEQAPALHECSTAAEWFTPAALHAVATTPSRICHLSWPIINIALWAKRWWG